MTQFWPEKITTWDIWMNAFWSFIAGLVWSIIIVIFTAVLSNIVDFWAHFNAGEIWVKKWAFFPMIFSIVTFIGTSIMLYFTYFIANKINPQRYSRNIIIFWQIAFFGILTYFMMTPIYLVLGMQNYDYLLYIFLIHTFTVTFWVNIILEVLNNYRHVLIGIYGSFIGIFFSSLIALWIFEKFPDGTAKMLSLIILLPVINLLITGLKNLFEFIYYHYTIYTNTDGLGDIFYQIEMEEKEALREEELKNSI